jgi:hypothetical protein
MLPFYNPPVTYPKIRYQHLFKWAKKTKQFLPFSPKKQKFNFGDFIPKEKLLISSNF